MAGPVTTHPAICRFCGITCPITVEIQDGRAVKVVGNRRSPTYAGFCCSKGQALPEAMRDDSRLLHSMKMQPDGSHRPIAWREALAEIAPRVREIIQTHGPNAVAVYFGTASGSYPATRPIVRGLFGALGSNRIFSPMTIDQPGKDIGAAMLGTWEAGGHPFHDARVWMMVGSNPLVSIGAAMPSQNPGRKLTDAIARGMRLIVIDPRRSQTAQRAHLHLQARPGHDAAILAAMIRVILDERLEDHDFIEENVAGIEALRAAVAPFRPERVAAQAGIEAEQLVGAARMFAAAGRGIACGSTGANMSGNSTLTEYLILCLNTICGRYLREGEAVANPGVLISRAIPRAQPKAPTPAVFPDQPMSVRGLSMCASGWPVAAAADEILAGKIKALFCIGGNPVAAWPDQKRTIAALEQVELFATFDIKMTPSAKLAHYVIAPKMGLEVPHLSYAMEQLEIFAGIWGLSEPFGMYGPKLTDPPPGSDVVEEWEFFYELARELGVDKLTINHAVEKGTTPRRERRPPIELDLATKPTTDDIYEMITRGSRIPLEEVKRHPDGALFPETIVAAPKDPDCTARLDVGNPEMMAELAGGAAEPKTPLPDFPYLMICRRSAHVFNSSGLGVPTLMRKGGRYNPAYMHSDDLARLGVQAGGLVELASQHGRVRAVVEADDTLRPGMVSMSHAFGDLPRDDADVRLEGSNTSQLISVEDDFDRWSGIPRMSALPVSVRPLDPVPTGLNQARSG